MRKTTKAEFKRFCKAFRYYQGLFGCPEYEVYFEHKKIDALAEIERDVDACIAKVRFHIEIDEDDDTDGWVEITAKHEAIHLLLAKLKYLSEKRYASEDEIDREEERVVRILEKVVV